MTLPILVQYLLKQGCTPYSVAQILKVYASMIANGQNVTVEVQ